MMIMIEECYYKNIIKRLDELERLIVCNYNVQKTLNIREVSLLTGYSPSVLYRKVCKCQIPYYKRDGFLYFDREEIETWMKQRLEENIDPKLLATKIDDLPFFQRTKNALKLADVITVNDLLKYNLTNLMKFKGFGRKSMNEIKDFLWSKNIKLKF